VNKRRRFEPDSGLCLIVGLGNPGRSYQKTRHNVGFLAVDEIAESYRIEVMLKKFDALLGKGVLNGRKVFLAKPMNYMNRSGEPTRRIADYYRITGKDLIVIHDDVDLPFGRIKIKEKGGDAGHKGVRSVIDAFGSDDFPRVRIGVGRGKMPLEAEIDISDHVLGRFNLDEIDKINRIMKLARDAVVTIVCNGITQAMNTFNNRKLILDAK
jgi:PTH1 family peptidyl-tRNA hydrolase